MKLSHFPENCHLAKPKPPYKIGTKANHKNFRQIFCLTLFWKIIKKVIHDQSVN